VFWRATLCHRNNANYPTDFTNLPMVNSFLHRHRWTISIYRWWIGLSSVPTDSVLEGYLSLSHNANYLIHQQTFQIYRWWIHFSIGTDGQSLFTDGELAYHQYRWYRWTVFWRATLASLTNANYLIHQQTFQSYRWWIHFSIGTDGQSLFTDGELAYHRYRRYLPSQ
jgi:hypothetical protein